MSKETGTTKGAQLLHRAFDLLDDVAHAGSPTVKELASHSGLPTSSVYRIIQALESRGYVYRAFGRIYLGAAWSQNARAFSAAVGDDLRATADPILHDLSHRLHATTVLSVRCGHLGLLLARDESELSIFRTIRVGEFYPLTAGALGRVMLAYCDRSVQEIAVREVASRGQTSNSCLRLLREQLADVRRVGYAFTAGEVQPGTMGVFAPILERHRILASVGAIFPVGPMPEYRLNHVRQEVVDSAGRLHRGFRAVASAADKPSSQ